ncbi:MAG TPA: hypothetical protein IAD11_06410 [Candidatus Stercorousia faecigallinarum]|jgi:hypothetical protein|nr:hypothetical protein [Candidatus Stercorousia faecigallinarum]
MSKGELGEDLGNLQAEYRYKISRMTENFRNGKYYNSKIYKRMAETLAGYMAAYDELEQLLDLRWKGQQNEWFKPSKYNEYLDRILKIGL